MGQSKSTPQQPGVVSQEDYRNRSHLIRDRSIRRSPPARPPPPRSIANNQSQVNQNSVSIERQRNPYNYVREELPQAFEHRLYPNVPTSTSLLYTQRVNDVRPTSRTTQKVENARYENARAWIETHYSGNANMQAPVTSPTNFVMDQDNFRLQPSAPPAPPSPSPSPMPASETSSTRGPGRNNNNYQRNNSSNRPQNKSKFILCETCNNNYGNKIYQCHLNHGSCQSCKNKKIICGKCSGAILDRRNFELEKFMVANNYKIRCPNADDGCNLSIKAKEISDHQKECPFRDLKCPMLNESCNWQGKINQLSQHFDEKHPSYKTDVDTEMVQNICGDLAKVHLIKLGKFHFLLYTQVSETERKIYMAVQFFGTKMSAMKWNYEIHIYNKREPRRKYQYFDCCRSSNEALEGIKDGNCVVLPINYAMTYIADGNLTYKCFIKKEFDERYTRVQKRR